MELLVPILKVNLVFAVLFAAYLLLLRRETFFQANRVWLLASALLAWVLPFIVLPTGAPLAVFTYGLPSYQVTVGPVPAPSIWDAVAFLDIFYLVGVAVALLVFAWRLFHVGRAFRKPGGEAFSFFRRVALPIADEDTARAFHAHEDVHVRLGHSFDVLLLELLAALSWWNPLWRWAIRELRTVHEHQADAVASQHHPDYDRLLLANALGVPLSTLTNSFRSSDLKTRIAMLHRDRSPRTARLKYMLAAPVLLTAFVSIAWTAEPFVPAAWMEAQQPVQQAEQMPEFPGGQQAMMTFLSKAIVYPEQAKAKKVEGKVIVSFVVATDGHVEKVEVKHGAEASLDDEALRVVRTMPAWRPGMDKGKVVPVQLVLPIVFKL